eukprot:TRINITY_DN10354_c0_g1_i1.p1 TRINITY_DN10354_c0_g1~~TRINITY_DN10354_c0_g1_i1.p1  ORF type:complete len:370 (-),score=68.02 TRINITY_DN10354_c0_g1_i1:246-1355(-)
MHSTHLSVVFPFVGVTISDSGVELCTNTITVSLNNEKIDWIDHNVYTKTSTEDMVTQQNSVLLPESTAPPQWIMKSIELVDQGKFELCQSGVGGTYFVKDETSSILSVFKPNDEEPGSLNNPKQLVDTPILPPGGGAVREVAACMLDNNFAGVPETALLEEVPFHIKGNTVLKTGSLQKFVANNGDVSSYGYQKFLVEDVHRIGVLDMRTMNLDRNEENILVSKQNDTYRLIPIDHSYILPESINNEDIWFEWMNWPQSKKPFSSQTLDYIKEIDIDADAQTLQALGLSTASIRTMRICTTLLKLGAQCGLTLFEIASIMCKPAQKSQLQKLVEEAEQQASTENFFTVFARLSESYLKYKMNEHKNKGS